MNAEQLWALVLFATASSITPGPNNMMMLASGVNYGLLRSVPHWLGISTGFGLMLVCLGLGLHAVLGKWPVLYTILRWLGAAYMLYLAYKIAHAAPPQEGVASHAKPMGFWAAAAFQWVNPKAVVMAITAINTFLPAGASPTAILTLALVFTLVNMPCVDSWALFGHTMRAWLQNPRYLRWFNWSMALALVVSLYPLVGA